MRTAKKTTWLSTTSWIWQLVFSTPRQMLIKCQDILDKQETHEDATYYRIIQLIQNQVQELQKIVQHEWLLNMNNNSFISTLLALKKSTWFASLHKDNISKLIVFNDELLDKHARHVFQLLSCLANITEATINVIRILWKSKDILHLSPGKVKILTSGTYDSLRKWTILYDLVICLLW